MAQIYSAKNEICTRNLKGKFADKFQKLVSKICAQIFKIRAISVFRTAQKPKIQCFLSLIFCGVFSLKICQVKFKNILECAVKAPKFCIFSIFLTNFSILTIITTQRVIRDLHLYRLFRGKNICVL